MEPESQKDDPAKPSKKKRKFRSSALSVTFVSGFASDWEMAVPECFRVALDIRWTPKVEVGQTVMAWTEGNPPVYDFHIGDIIYDNNSAYGQAWGEALTNISVAIQVMAARPDLLDGKGAKTPGTVVAGIYRPKPDRSGLELVAQHRMTQDEFVQTLKSGELPGGIRL